MEENFESQQPLEVHFGLGDAKKIERLQIEWPSGRVEVHRNLRVDQHLGVAPGGRLCPMFFELRSKSISKDAQVAGFYQVRTGDLVRVKERGALRLLSGYGVGLRNGLRVETGGSLSLAIDPDLRIP